MKLILCCIAATCCFAAKLRGACIVAHLGPNRGEDCYEGTEPGADWGLEMIPGLLLLRSPDPKRPCSNIGSRPLKGGEQCSHQDNKLGPKSLKTGPRTRPIALKSATTRCRVSHCKVRSEVGPTLLMRLGTAAGQTAGVYRYGMDLSLWAHTLARILSRLLSLWLQHEVREDAGGQRAADRVFDIIRACMSRLFAKPTSNWNQVDACLKSRPRSGDGCYQAVAGAVRFHIKRYGGHIGRFLQSCPVLPESFWSCLLQPAFCMNGTDDQGQGLFVPTSAVSIKG
eukprot:122239-Amphidinium_carterae.1